MKKNKGQSPIDRSVQADVNRALSRANASLQGSSIVKRLSGILNITTNGVGSVGITVTSAMVSSLSSEWASFAARYLDFRVLKVKVTYQPFFVVNTRDAATNDSLGGAGCIVSDPSGSATLVSTTQAWALEGAKVVHLLQKFKHQTTASQEEHMLFNPTSATQPAANRFQTTGFISGASASTTYGVLFLEWICEYRGSQ